MFFDFFIGIIGWTPDKRIPEFILTFFDKVRVLIFANQRVYFDVFRQSLRFNFRPSKQSFFYVFGVFVDSRGGSLGKCIPEDFLDKVCVLNFAH